MHVMPHECHINDRISDKFTATSVRLRESVIGGYLWDYVAGIDAVLIPCVTDMINFGSGSHQPLTPSPPVLF